MSGLQQRRRSIGERAVQPFVSVLLRLKVSPNVVTLAGTATTVVAAWLAAEGTFFWAGVLMLAGSALDMVDGALARAGGSVSRFGAVLDSMCDRISEAVLLLGIAFWFTQTGDVTALVVTYVALISSFLVSYLRARGEGLGLTMTVGLCTRPERVIVLSLGLLTGFVFVAVSLVALCASVTVVQRLIHVRQTGKETPD